MERVQASATPQKGGFFSLDIRTYWIIIRLCPHNRAAADTETIEGASDVGNNSTKKQTEAKTPARIPETHEHGGRQKSDQPAEGKGTDAPLGVTTPALSAMPYAYRKSERLRKNNEFVSVMKQGKRLSVDGLSLFYAENNTADFRVGISVSRKLTRATGRNKLKRRLRGAISQALEECSRGYDLVFVARQGLVGAGFDRVLRSVRSLLVRSVLRGTKE